MPLINKNNTINLNSLHYKIVVTNELQMKILLLHPSYHGKFKGIPLGLVNIATALHQQHHTVTILDLDAQSLSDSTLQSYLLTQQPHLIGIASTSPSHLEACRLARLTKQTMNIPVIKGGVHETYCSETTLQHHPEIDISMQGYAEQTICDVVNAIEHNQDLSHLTGITYRNNQHAIIKTPPPATPPLDSYPHPQRSLLQHSTSYNFPIFHGAKTTQTRMSRGCSYGCTFCPIERSFQFHSANYVMQELQTIKDQGYQALFWDDAIFTAHSRLVTDILEQTIQQNLNFQMGAQTRADVHITPELLSIMQRAGFTYLSFGLESGDESLLAQYNKRLHIDAVEQAVKLAKQYGMHTSLTAIIGSPDEKLSSVEKTIDVINKIQPDYVSWSIYSIYPGSSLPFNPLWYEDPSLSIEPFWQQFDEGYRAKHVCSIEYAQQALELIKQKMDVKIKM